LFAAIARLGAEGSVPDKPQGHNWQPARPHPPQRPSHRLHRRARRRYVQHQQHPARTAPSRSLPCTACRRTAT